jgi:hypothetical protein
MVVGLASVIHLVGKAFRQLVPGIGQEASDILR